MRSNASPLPLQFSHHIFSFRRISQPDEINWKGVHGFTASSRDDMLHQLAQQYSCNLKGSTSSVSGVLSHIYFALSNFKRVRTKLLSSHFKVILLPF
jgi:hypothetical protein